MIYTLQNFYQNTQNNLFFTDIKARKCISLESIYVFISQKNKIFHKQIQDVYFSVLICIVYFKQIGVLESFKLRAFIRVFNDLL